MSTSPPLITARPMQAACFHDDKDTLEMNSNVAGTGKAGAKVEVAFDIQLKECPAKLKMPWAKRSVFPAVIVKLGLRIPVFDFRRKAIARRIRLGDAS